MLPTERPETFGLAAKRKVISQSSSPRCEPEAPRNRTSPAAKPRNGAALSRPGQGKQRRFVRLGHTLDGDIVRLGEVVDRHGDIHTLDVFAGRADCALVVGRSHIRRGVGAERLQALGYVLSAAAGIKRKAALARIRAFSRSVADRAVP